MLGLKFRETNIVKIIEESLSRLSRNDQVVVILKSSVENGTVWIDHEQMVTAFFDLMNNALEAMRHGGLLTITLTGDEWQVTVEIADSGTGIAAENVPFLFTPFFTTKPVGDGTGLGLPTAYAAVKAHHGDITIESNNDTKNGPTGTKVRIKLPRRQILQNKQSRMILHEE